jgi:phospholipase C
VAEVTLVPHPDTGPAELVLRNDRNAPTVFTIALDEHYPTSDFLVTVDGARDFVRRFAGKIETGKPGQTDPGIGPMRMTV